MCKICASPSKWWWLESVPWDPEARGKTGPGDTRSVWSRPLGGDAVGLATLTVPRKSLCGHLLTAGKPQM